MLAHSSLALILAGLMDRYRERVPNVQRVIDLLVREKLIADPDAIENDHIAFRTMGVPQLGIASFEKIFLHHGYERRDAYHFDGKKLDAFWYSPPETKLPRIFVSELRVGDLDEGVQSIIRSYTDEVTCDPVDDLDLDDADSVVEFLHRPLWRTPTLTDYQRLAEVSEYAAWVIYNRYYLNHFTISVHNLPVPYDCVQRFNELLEAEGIVLNESGGKVKVSGDGLLRQSSTMAALVEAEFAWDSRGVVRHAIPGSYIEFAERRVLPEFRELPVHQIGREHRRDGFETANADRIFESTNRLDAS